MIIAEHKEADATNIICPFKNEKPSRDDKSEAVPNTKYETQKGFLRRALRVSIENSHSIEELKSRLLSDYRIHLSESRGRFSFQMPERAKPIRARQLGTDFEKESIVKYFEERDGRTAMPVPDRAAHQGNENTIESAVSSIKVTAPDDHRTGSITIQKTNTQENITIPKIQRSENQKSVGIQKISNPDHAMVQEKTASRDTKDLPNATTHTDQRTWDITGRPQPHVTPIPQAAKIPVTPAQQAKPQKSASQIGNQMHTASPNRSEHSAEKSDTPAPSVRLITDLENCIKAQQNRNYAQKVKISNLKEMSNTMNFLKENGIGSWEELDALVDTLSDDTETKKLALRATEGRLKTVNLLIKDSGQYFANKKVYSDYLQARNKTAFREEHRTEIALYESARRELKQLSGGKPIPTMKQLKAEKEKLLSRKNEQYEAFSVARSKRHELQNVQQNVRILLSKRQHTQTHKHSNER